MIKLKRRIIGAMLIAVACTAVISACSTVADNKTNDDVNSNIDNLKISENISESNFVTPEKAVTEFFEAFAKSDFSAMKEYCTQHCADTYFRENSVFGMTKAAIAEMRVEPEEYAKSSNDFNVFVTVNMSPSEVSAYDPSETSASFYLILQRQSNGGYLINDFATGI